jgi:prepilin-type N-terminal cleavage/methylation domain-containing protein
MTYQNSKREPAGFTVIELMVVVSIMALLVAMGLSAFNAAVAQSKISRTKVIIAKLDQLIMDRYESYRTRPVPIRAPAGQDPRLSARYRLNALREIMRLELPQCQEDIQTNPTLVQRTAISRGYTRKLASVTWSDQWEEAECLYLIIASMRDGDKSALDFFTTDEIGDTDGDQVPEILDSWGNPIQFIRWAPGYRSDATNPALSMQNMDTPDSFDPQKADNRFSTMGAVSELPNGPIDLKPLIYSFGPDRVRTGLQIVENNPPATVLNDPYHQPGGIFIGEIDDATAVGDNITNHYQEAE